MPLRVEEGDEVEREEIPGRPLFVGIPSVSPGAKQAPKPSGGGSGRKSKDKLDVDQISELVSAAFEAPYHVTGHDWWRRDTEEVRPISVPLTNILNDLSPPAKALIDKYMQHLLLLAGTFMVVSPAVLMEMQLKKEISIERQRRLRETRGIAPSTRRNGFGEPAPRLETFSQDFRSDVDAEGIPDFPS